MKGTQGLVIAAALAIVGAACNWFYITNKASDLEREAFIYIKAGKVNEGDKFKEEHFGKLEIPRKYVGGLKGLAVRWSDRRTVIGQAALHDYPTDRLLMREDLRTPSQKSLSQQLDPDEVSQPVMVNPATFVAANYNPLDYVFFKAPFDTRNSAAGKKPLPKGPVGPFRILRIGSRSGSSEVQRGRGIRDSRSNIITVPLKKTKDGYDAKSTALLQLLQAAGRQGLEVEVQSARKRKEEAASM